MNDHSSSTDSCSCSSGSRRARSTVSAHSRSLTSHASRNPSAVVGRNRGRSGWRRSSSASHQRCDVDAVDHEALDLAVDRGVETSTSRIVTPRRSESWIVTPFSSTVSNREPDRSARANSLPLRSLKSFMAVRLGHGVDSRCPDSGPSGRSQQTCTCGSALALGCRDRCLVPSPAGQREPEDDADREQQAPAL